MRRLAEAKLPTSAWLGNGRNSMQKCAVGTLATAAAAAALGPAPACPLQRGGADVEACRSFLQPIPKLQQGSEARESRVKGKGVADG